MSDQPAGFRRLSEESVRGHTGKGWAEWLAILDAWEMRAHGHKLTAKHLEQTYGLTGWWAQAVTIRYEYERGLRET